MKSTKIPACIALVMCAATCAFPAVAPAQTQEQNGLEAAADAIRGELAPSLSTFEALQAEQNAEEGIDIRSARVQGLQDVQYNGQEKTPAISLKLEGETLREGEDFDVAFLDDAVNPGRVGVTITGKGAYFGTIEAGFTILPADLSHATIDVIADHEETGAAIEPAPVVKLDGYELAEGVDYTVSYHDNVELGLATLVVEGMGNCTGSTHASFEITEAPDAPSSGISPSADAGRLAAIAAGIVALGGFGVAGVLRKKKRP